ncbi:hypothetical protein [Streptomyces sp. NBC_01429]|uniref:hypothetical protein n=1 Tax=Streptomyces sp. NBC_01429 TaxID=2903862 RepID=UPI002E2CB127|nr:hypothetical protein [Streptomyces sp. NBC_01429]
MTLRDDQGLLPVAPPDVSCYTTNLLSYLTADVPEAGRRLARSVRLAVRTDLPPGELAFSHHARVDRTADNRELAYRGAADWSGARAGLRDALDRDGRVLAVAGTARLPWSPAYGRADAPHWVLIHGCRAGRWLVADHFTALTPYGEHRPHLGRLDDAELAGALALAVDSPVEVVRRDRLALGSEVPLPSIGPYRWLARVPVAMGDSGPEPGPGQWIHETARSLTHIRAVMAAHPDAVGRFSEDLWAAARHHAYALACAGAEGSAHTPHRAASAAWAELPRALRFAAQSAERGRPRPGLAARALTQLISAESALPGTGVPDGG